MSVKIFFKFNLLVNFRGLNCDLRGKINSFHFYQKKINKINMSSVDYEDKLKYCFCCGSLNGKLNT